MFQKLSKKLSKRIGNNRKSAGRRLSLHRGLFIEPLESRQLLSVTLSPIGDQSVFAGAPLNLALDSTSGNPLTYTVQVSDSNLSATVSQDNPSIRITIDDETNNIHGDVTIQLFEDLAPNTVDKIMALVDSGYYDGLTFHRIISDFMVQGGDPNGDGSGGPDFDFDDEFTPELQFTGPGLLAMANSGDDTNGSQFFITVEPGPYRSGDFNYTIFGMVTEGMDIVEQLSEVPVDTSNNYRPINNAFMTTVTVVNDTEDAVLRLSAEDGVTGTFDVTVTVTDTVTNQTDTETFEVTVSADTNNNRPYLDEIDPIVIDDGQPAVVMIPAIDVEGDAIFYFVESNDNNITASIDGNTGELTVTPANGVYGVFSVTVKVSYASGVNYSDTQDVPVYVSPSAPTSVTLISSYDAGSSDSDAITNLDNSAAGQVLGFEIEGVEIGALVQLYADGQFIGETTAAGTTVTIVTYGTYTLSEGTHEITVKQTMEDQDVLVGNLDTTVDLESELSSALTLTVDTVLPEITSSPVTTAYVEGTYIYQISATDDTTDLTFSLEESPSGMTIDPDTGRITWTSITGEGNTEQVTVRATDTAGNYIEQTYDLSIAAANTTPMLTSAEPVIETTDEDTPKLFSLSASIINNGDSTTMITDADDSAVVGGIALTGWTGNGTWAYSFDGTTYYDIGAVSATSALLLPADTTLRYTPDGDNGESATITYVAWDGTTGHDGIGEVDTTSGGDHSAFSADSDTATLNVTAVNDAPVLTPAEPSAGDIGTDQSAVIVVSDYINNGDGTTTVTDVDADAVTNGIALIGLTGNGAWQYSLDGTAFVAILDVSSNSALLLPGDAVLKYTPAGGGSEEVEITYRAWDTVTGTAGGVVDTTGNGGTTSFSTATDTLTLTVNADTGSIAGFVYIDTDNDGLRITPDGQSHLALQSVAVKLYKSDGQGNWTLVSTVSTGSDGSYMFDNLTSGTYRVREVQPIGYIDGRETLGMIDGAKQGIVGADLFEIAFGTDDHGIEYNFGERGIVASAISLRLCLASASTPSQSVTPPETDITAPSGYSVTADDSLVGSAESDNVSFTFSGAEVGTTYNYTVTSSGGDGEASGSGTIGSASHQVSGIDVSALPDGELTFTVTLTDASGNMGAAATASTTLDQTAPDGYSLVLDDDYLDENDADSISFQINNGEVGAKFAYVITSDGGDGTVSGNGTIASMAHFIDGVDVSGLPDGTLSVKIALRDVAGNLGETVIETTTLDQTAPVGYSITANEEHISQAESESTSFTFAGAEVGATYNYTVSSSAGGTPITGSGTVTSATQTIDGINVSSLPDGELTFSVTLTDIGNKTGDAVTSNAILDTVAPTGYYVTPDDATVDSDSATDIGFYIYNALPGATYSYTITSDGGDGSVTNTGTVTLESYHVHGIDVSTLPDGLLTITLTLTDEAGNEGTEETATFTLDTST